LLVQLVHSLNKLLLGGSGKSVNLDVADTLLGHVGGIDAIDWNTVAGDGELHRCTKALTMNEHGYLGSLWASQQLMHIGDFQVDIGYRLAINGNYSVAG